MARIVITRDPDAGAVKDGRISAAALGILGLILAHGHGSHCDVDAIALSRLARAGGGKRGPSSAKNMTPLMAELESAGYVLRRRIRSGGPIGGMEVQVSDDPCAGWDDAYVSPAIEHLDPGQRVYLIAAQGLTVAKIGTTGNLTKRLAALQGGSPVPLSLSASYAGGYLLEEYLHRRFDSIRIHGEWFDFGQQDAAGETARAVEEYRIKRSA